MRNILTLLALLATTSLIAETSTPATSTAPAPVTTTSAASAPVEAATIEKLDYKLPESAKNWIIFNEVKSAQGTTIVYAPKQTGNESPKESFGLSISNLPLGDMTQESLTKSLQKQFPPDLTVKVNILEKDTDSIVFEWSIWDKEAEKVHGWSRAFKTHNGSAIAQYITENIQTSGVDGPLWLNTLKNVKIVK